MPVPDLLPPAWRPVLEEGPLPIPIHSELHPVRWDYGERFYALENSAMGGPSANPVFGPTVAAADVYWRLYAATGRGSWLADGTATIWRDTALTGSLLAFNQLLDETVARAPQISTIRTAADLLLNPNISLRAPGGKHPVVGHDTSGGNARKLNDEALQQGLTTGKPEPRLGVGLDWSTRSADEPPSAPLLKYAAWVATSNIGISNLRAEVDLLHGAWTVTGRERLWRSLSFIGTARSQDRTFEPSSWSGGLSWAVPWTTGWTVRADRKQTFDVAPDVTWMVTIRGDGKTPVPRGILF